MIGTGTTRKAGEEAGGEVCTSFTCIIADRHYQRGGRVDTCKTDTSVLFFIL